MVVLFKYVFELFNEIRINLASTATLLEILDVILLDFQENTIEHSCVVIVLLVRKQSSVRGNFTKICNALKSLLSQGKPNQV